MHGRLTLSDMDQITLPMSAELAPVPEEPAPAIPLRVVILFESSGVIREAFRALGHDAWSCDLQPADDGSPYHFQCDAREVLMAKWDMVGMHPPCTFLCGSGLHWNDRGRGWERTDEALRLVRQLMSQDVPWYLENPVGIISTRIRECAQTIQPYEFGEDASKATCLWLNYLPLLKPTRRVPGRLVEFPTGSGLFVERWANQTDGGQNRLAPSKDRWKERSRTYPGIAAAMAEQWSSYLVNFRPRPLVNAD